MFFKKIFSIEKGSQKTISTTKEQRVSANEPVALAITLFGRKHLEIGQSRTCDLSRALLLKELNHLNFQDIYSLFFVQFQKHQKLKITFFKYGIIEQQLHSYIEHLSNINETVAFLVGAFSLKEKSPTITVSSFFQLTISL